MVEKDSNKINKIIPLLIIFFLISIILLLINMYYPIVKKNEITEMQNREFKIIVFDSDDVYTNPEKKSDCRILLFKYYYNRINIIKEYLSDKFFSSQDSPHFFVNDKNLFYFTSQEAIFKELDDSSDSLYNTYLNRLDIDNYKIGKKLILQKIEPIKRAIDPPLVDPEIIITNNGKFFVNVLYVYSLSQINKTNPEKSPESFYSSYICCQPSTNHNIISCYNQYYPDFGNFYPFCFAFDLCLYKNNNIRKLATSYPLYYQLKNGRNWKHPHKCWNPEGTKILFVGSLEKFGEANVYIFDIKTDEKYKIPCITGDAGTFNPNLEWSEFGILITCQDSIHFKPKNSKKFKKLSIPEDINSVRGGKISPDGKYIYFFAKKGKLNYIFVMDINKKKYVQFELGEGDILSLEGSWINENGVSILKNQKDFLYWYGSQSEIEKHNRLFVKPENIKIIEDSFKRRSNFKY